MDEKREVLCCYHSEKTMPFTMHLETPKAKNILGIANEKYVIPDSIDKCKDEITKMFAVERL